MSHLTLKNQPEVFYPATTTADQFREKIKLIFKMSMGFSDFQHFMTAATSWHFACFVTSMTFVVLS
jgi:hypothetical protein